MKTWQEARDLCTAAGTTLPIPRSEADVHALCATHYASMHTEPHHYVWTGIIKGSEHNSFINYLDQSPAPYLTPDLIHDYDDINSVYSYDNYKCMVLQCADSPGTYIPSQNTYFNVGCDGRFDTFNNFCEDPRKYLFEKYY